MTREQKVIFDRLKARLTVSTLHLEEDLIELPMFVMEIGEHHADAIKEHGAAEHELEIVEADVADLLRRKPIPAPTKASGDTATKTRSEAQIKAELPLHEKVIDAATAVANAAHDVALWRALQDASRTKDRAVHRVAELVITGYLTKDTVYKEGRRNLNEARQRRTREREAT